jgi:hypothetical protein
VRWLLILGLSFDGVGAALIAWPLVVPRPEEREEGISRWGGNPWQTITRLREARFVQIGAFFLALGFVLQAGAYIWSFDSSELWASLLVVATLVAGVTVGLRIAGKWVPKYVVAQEAVFSDQRQAFNVSTVEDYRKLLETYVASTRGRLPVRIGQRSKAVLRQGQWQVACPECGQHTIVVAWSDNPDAICTDGGHEFGVDFPSEAELRRFEQVLGPRDPAERNWSPGDEL